MRQPFVISTNTADGHTVTTKYYYDNANRPSKSYLNAYVDHQYTYDTLGRLNYTTVNYKNDATVKLDYTYANAANRSSEDVTYITSQISKEEIGDRGYAYTYDKVGNITKITEKKTASGSYANKATYTYDPLDQLKRENNVDLNKTIVYTYNSGGNITKRTEYPYTTGTVGTATKTVNYTYDSTWKDKLISYDGDGITYDAIGNPLTYRDGMSFTWQGRQMKTANLNGTSVSYKYNADGLRTYKKVGSTVHEYEYSGDKLFYEKRGDIRFYYRYDVNGNIAAITRIKADGTKFTLYPICNSRGDVEELRKDDGTLYARYVYDSWGNTLHIYNASGAEITDTANLSLQNPFRYRGYYYDAESGIYYLQSRYYDPVTCRFVNADSLVDTSSVLGFNMYAYCGNNPVNYSDPSGHFLKEAWNRFKDGVKKAGTWINENLVQPVKKFFTRDNKNIVVNANSLPTTGEPGSSRTLKNPDGTPKQKRWYGGDGKAERDRDYNHPGKDIPFPHDHEWKNGKRQKDHLPPSPNYRISLEPVVGISVVAVCTLGITYVLVNNVTGVGVADDFLLAPLSVGVESGLIMITS